MFDDRHDISYAIRAALNYLDEDQVDKVIVEVERVFSLDSMSAEGIHVLGLLAVKMNEPLRAKDLFIKAVELAPGKYEHAEALAIVNAKLGLITDSLFYGKLAAALTPYPFIKGFLPDWLGTFEDNFLNIQDKPHFKYGKYYYELGHFRHAIEYLQKAVEVDSKDANAWRMLARSLRICDRSYESLLMHKALDEVGLNDPSDLSEVALVLSELGLFEESLSCHREVLNFAVNNHKFFSNYIVSLQKTGLLDDTQNAERDWALLFLEPIFSYDFAALLSESKNTIRIGLVSGRFRSKNGLDHLWPLIINHGQPQMKFNCYSYNDYDDIVSRKIAGAANTWTDLSKIDDKTAATIIHNDGVDILIDLDSNLETSRPKVFSYNPAPIMLKYLGMEKSTPTVGYAGVFGGKHSYLNNDVVGVLVEKGIASLSPEINPDKVTFAKMQNNQAPSIGLAPTGSELTPAFYESIKDITSALPNSKIVLNTRHLGGGGNLDGIEKQLNNYGIQDKVKFTTLDNDKYLAISDFISQCDVLVVLDHMRSADIVWEFVNSFKPVFALNSGSPHLREVNEILEMLGKGDWLFDSIESLVSDLENCFNNNDDSYEKLSESLCQSIKERISLTSINDKGLDLLTSFAEFRKEFLSSRIHQQNKGE